MESNLLKLSIHDREKGKLFEGNIRSVSSMNTKGSFDILPDHSQFISLVQKELKITHPDNRVEQMVIGNGVLRVIHNTVAIYLGIKS
jgi:F0F1-type ATP synthase epsilon subunit